MMTTKKHINKWRKSVGDSFHNTGRTRFKKGLTPWNKGIKIDKKKFPNMGHNGPHTQATKDLISRNRKGQFVGERHPQWKGGITSLNLKQRALFRKTIQKRVFERDNYTCQLCGETGIPLTVDHIQSWAEYVELRFSINNCRTLCERCHYKITYGKEMPKSIKSWGHNLKKIEGGILKFA